MNASMSSPPKRSRRSHHAPIQRSSESELPLHLALAYIVVRAHPVSGEGTPTNIYSHGFIGSILQLVATEIYEVGPSAKPFDILKREVDALVHGECTSIARLNDKVRSRGQVVSEDRGNAETFQSWLETFAESFGEVASGCAFLDTLEKDVRSRMNEDDEEDLTELPEPIERRSPFGLFLRSILLTLRKLSFDETAQLSHQVASWCGVAPGPSRTGTHLWSLNRKLAMEATLDKRSDAMSEYQRATESGDYSKALNSLRRFYDYQFPSSGRGQHQHALLNLAIFHYSQGGLPSARAALDEAIRVARAENDRACLRQCMSLLSRLSTETSSSAFLPGETPRIHQQPIAPGRLPKSVTPMDDLWALKAAVDMGEPAHIAMRRIHLALARQEEHLVGPEGKKESKQGTRAPPFPIAPWHATQAGLWTLMGCDELARAHEDLALDSAACDADVRLTVLLYRADRAVDTGDYAGALSMLVDYQTVDQMTITTYHRWARKVWSILERQASLSDDQEALDIVQALKPPDELSLRLGPGGNNRELGQPLSVSGMEDPNLKGVPLAHEEIRASLRKARKMQDANVPPHIIISHVLSAVQLSSELGLWPVYRTGIILLAEVMLCMEAQGMSRKAIDEVESVWDQVLSSGNQEDIARGAIALAKGTIDHLLDEEVAGEQPDQDKNMRLAEEFLRTALTAAERIGSRRLILPCTTLSALLAELKGEIEESMVDKWREARDGNVGQLSGLRDEIRRVGEIIKLVGVRVAENWT